MLYGKNSEVRAKAITVVCSKNYTIDDPTNQLPITGKIGPTHTHTHTPVTAPIVAAIITSGKKYPIRNFKT